MSRGFLIKHGRVDRAVFPPEQVAEVKAVACDSPSQEGVPLSRRSVADVHRLVIERGIADASSSTIVRWLREDAIRPWQYRSWIFPTDPEFATKAGRILDLYQGRWAGELLHPGDMIISADEKPSIQARGRIAPTLPPKAGVLRGQRVEHTYERNGALTYLAAWDVRRGGVIGRCEPKGEIEPFGGLFEQVMTAEPLRVSAQGVLDRGQRQLAPRQAVRGAAAGPVADPPARAHPGARLLAEVSSRGESHPPALAEPGVNLSAHRAPITQPANAWPSCQ